MYLLPEDSLEIVEYSRRFEEFVLLSVQFRLKRRCRHHPQLDFNPVTLLSRHHPTMKRGELGCEKHAQELPLAFVHCDSDIAHKWDESCALVSDCSAHLKTHIVESPGDRLHWRLKRGHFSLRWNFLGRDAAGRCVSVCGSSTMWKCRTVYKKRKKSRQRKVTVRVQIWMDMCTRCRGLSA